MRAFIAIELPQEIKALLTSIQEQLKSTAADIKWVAPQNIHLTLKFLGEVEDKKLEKIMEILKYISQDKNAFYIRLSSLGAFPKTNFPRVIWVGLDKGDEETKQIVKALEEEMLAIGIPKESRPFSSHITIGRVSSGLNRDKLVKQLMNLADSPGKKTLAFQVTTLTLFKSTLTPKGPIYEVLKEAHLKTN